MKSILEVDGPERLIRLWDEGNLPDVLALPDIAFCIAIEILAPMEVERPGMLDKEVPDAVTACTTQLMQAVLRGELPADLRREDAPPDRVLYSLDELSIPWLTISDLIQRMVKGSLPESVTVFVHKEHFRRWTEQARVPLPVFWSSDKERQAQDRTLAALAAEERDATRGRRVRDAAARGGKSRGISAVQKQKWQEVADCLTAENPRLSKSALAAQIARKLGGRPNTIRKHIRLKES